MAEGGLSIGVLGALLVQRAGVEVRITSRKQQLVLGALVVAGRALVRDDLIDVLWGEEPPATAVGTLHTHISRLRALIGVDAVVDVGGSYRLDVPPRQVDSVSFAALVGEARRARDGGERDVARRRFHAALSLWRGPALDTFRYEPFAQLEIARLDALRLDAIEERCELDLDADDMSITADLEALCAANPFRERLTLLLMRALYRVGRQADALAAGQRLRAALRDDLGLEVTPEVGALERRILQQDPTLGAASPIAAPQRRWHMVMDRADLPLPDPARQCDQLTERAVTMRRAGRLDEARSCAAAAVRVAQQLQDRARLGAAALALAGPPEDAVLGEPLDAELLEAAVAGLAPDDPLASMLQARLAVGYIDAGDHDRGASLLDAAEAAASSGADAHAEVYVLRARHRTWFDPTMLDERLALDRRMERLAATSADAEDRTWATRWIGIDQLEAGDVDGYRRGIEALVAAGEQYHDVFHRWGAVVRDAGLRTATGPMDEADARTMEALEAASEVGSEYALAATAQLLFALRWRQCRLHELDGLVQELAARDVTARLLVPLVHLELGRHDEARRSLHELRCRGLRQALTADAVDVTRLTALTALSQAAFHLGDDDAARQLLTELAAVQATMAVAHPGICILAPIAELRAAVLGTLGDIDGAIAQAWTASGLCERTGCVAVGVRTDALLAVLLRQRGRREDVAHATDLEARIERSAAATGAPPPPWFITAG